MSRKHMQTCFCNFNKFLLYSNCWSTSCYHRKMCSIIATSLPLLNQEESLGFTVGKQHTLHLSAVCIKPKERCIIPWYRWFSGQSNQTCQNWWHVVVKPFTAAIGLSYHLHLARIRAVTSIVYQYNGKWHYLARRPCDPYTNNEITWVGITNSATNRYAIRCARARARTCKIKLG